ncbi:MAG: hypothetical protein AAB602_02495 [Patescibacteria group bacterium]
MAEHDPQEIAWEAPEFEYRHKDISWYWISIIVAVVCIGFAAWQKNFLFGFFVLVAEILILAWANQQPAIFNFRLTEKGLFIQNKKFYSYGDIETFSFYSSDEGDFENIVFRFHKHLRRPVKIAAPKNRFPEIQSFLSERVAEINHEPSLIDTIEKFIGF